jgi:hypothetical protein
MIVTPWTKASLAISPAKIYADESVPVDYETEDAVPRCAVRPLRQH